MESPPPEFEFWVVGNAHPPLEPSNILTADELIVDGVLLPLHLLSLAPEPKPIPTRKPEPDPKPEPEPPESHKEGASILSSSTAGTGSSSKRWKDIFKVVGGEKKKEANNAGDEKRKERKASNGGGAPELNINIWPFSRSRSAGTAGGGQPKAAAPARKACSAPCSRSNSRRESAGGGRRWAASPGRPGAGVHVGRASPVWRGPGKKTERAGSKARRGLGLNGGVRGLNLNVNSCIGYGSQVGCRIEDCDPSERANGGLFRIRALFSKKVY